MAKADPFAIEPVAVADQDPGPIVDQGLEGRFGAVGVDHEKGHHRVGHDPEPLQYVLFKACLWAYSCRESHWMAADWSLTNFTSCGLPDYQCVGPGDESSDPARQSSDATMGYRHEPLARKRPNQPASLKSSCAVFP